MSVEDVSELLRSWKIPEDIVLKFAENEVDEYALLKLPQNILSTLIVKAGPLVKFQQLLEVFKKSKQENINESKQGLYLESQGPPVKVRKIETSLPVQCINLSAISKEDLQNAEVVVGDDIDSQNLESFLNQSYNSRRNSNSTSTASSSSISNDTYRDEYDIKAILSSSTNGSRVLNHFNTHKKLDDYYRNLTAQCIIDHELKDDKNKQINADFISQKILEFFNANGQVEVKKTWYNPGQSSTKGKLITRYHNMRRKLLKDNVIEKRCKANENLEITLDDDSDEESQDCILWLKNNVIPWPKVLEYWEKTSSRRLRNIISENEPVYKYIDTYLPLKQSQALSLLEIDFEHLHSGKGLQLYKELKKLVSFVDDKLQQKKSKNYVSLSGLNQEQQIIALFTNLHLLFPVITCVNKKSNIWRPSREEVKEGFLLRVNTYADIKTTLLTRRRKLANFGLNLQPQPIIVGKDLAIEEQYIAIDNEIYSVESPLKVVDLTFKSVHALHAKYSPEAEPLWLFLQLAIYQIKTKWDRKLGAVETLVNEYELFIPRTEK